MECAGAIRGTGAIRGIRRGGAARAHGARGTANVRAAGAGDHTAPGAVGESAWTNRARARAVHHMLLLLLDNIPDRLVRHSVESRVIGELSVAMASHRAA